jgi:hypothetical protein
MLTATSRSQCGGACDWGTGILICRRSGHAGCICWGNAQVIVIYRLAGGCGSHEGTQWAHGWSSEAPVLLLAQSLSSLVESAQVLLYDLSHRRSSFQREQLARCKIK